MHSYLKLIVNADDFGMSHTKNLAIDQAMRRGLCTQTSIVVNTPGFNEAVRLAQEGGYIEKVSLHLNLTVGKPLTEEIYENRNWCVNGEFLYRPIIKSYKQILPTDILCIRNEVEAQILRFLNSGFKLKRIDSHNWVHLRLPVWLALKPLLKKYDVLSVRPMWKGYWRKEIAAKWCRYFYAFDKAFGMNKYMKVISYTSNIEQFVYRGFQSVQQNVAEVFTHPDIKEGEIFDTSSSYLKLPMYTLEENVAKISQYSKINLADVLD